MRLLLLLLAAPLAAQTADQPAVLVEAEAGTVLLDGRVAGAAGAWLAAPAGRVEVALVDDAAAWNPRRATATLTLAPGDSARVVLALPRRLRVETLPIRGTVVRETAAGPDTLGTAPLWLDVPEGEAVALAAHLDGYEPVRRTVSARDEAVTLVLPPGAGTTPEAALLPTERSTARRTLLDLGIGAAAVAAGAVAIHYKFRADAIDDRYRDPDDPGYADEALRQDALRLDRYSAAALGAMQIGVGVLALRFVLR